MKNQKLTQERLKELLHYCPDTGVFTWIVSKSKNIHVSDVAGCINSRGYRQIRIDGKTYKASRLAWLYMESYFPEHHCDHINRIKDDDRWENLRHVSHKCNMRNRGVLKSNSSGITGVVWRKQILKWGAQIALNKKQIYLGCFETKTEAVKARWDAEVKHNFPNCNNTSSAYLYLKEIGLLR